MLLEIFCMFVVPLVAGIVLICAIDSDIISTHESCVGFTLYSLGNRRAEIWFCPSGYAIKPHRHPKEDVKLMYLFGNTTFFRKNIYNEFQEWIKPTRIGKCFDVRHFHTHWFTVGKLPLVFVNFQTFLGKQKPQSAARDFLLED